ncbi:MAG: PilZ domain-containing protein [Sedimentibacter sp.]
MKITEKTVKIYDLDRNLLGIGLLLSMGSGMLKVKGHNLPIINSKTKIYVEIYDGFHGIRPFSCEVSLASENQLNVRIINTESIMERRKSLKVQTDLSLYIESLHRLDEDITKNVPSMKINILNLSIGGMLISSNYDLLINDIITFDFQYLDYQVIRIKAKVIRIDKILDSNTKEISALNYGCVFEKMAHYNEAVITKYLYNRQLQLYKSK